jgi:hypothetical protein
MKQEALGYWLIKKKTEGKKSRDTVALKFHEISFIFCCEISYTLELSNHNLRYTYSIHLNEREIKGITPGLFYLNSVLTVTRILLSRFRGRIKSLKRKQNKIQIIVSLNIYKPLSWDYIFLQNIFEFERPSYQLGHWFFWLKC